MSSEEEEVFDQHVAQDGNGLSALDIGCGTGELANSLSARGYNVLGIDCAETAVSLASSRYRDVTGLAFECRNVEDDQWAATLPSYDLVTSRLSYAFVQNKNEFLKRVKDHLAPGGIFYVMTPLADRLPHSRRYIGLTAEETEELCRGWTKVKEHDLDAQHACYALTL
ncbi:class I SAM-dependent methyltransferase [Streptomyces subrutilus]|uniref:class I SAM-dependent methyltransferase n=1 Tax=Streptomyces subrutilus TaxID=36818 RepID=UPI0033F1265A